MPRILVTGSRDWTDRMAVAREIIRYISENTSLTTDSQGYPVDWDTSDFVIVHGACATGADAMAHDYAINSWIAVEPHPANWTLGRFAGFQRNQEMVDAGADVCLAFLMECTKTTCKKVRPHWSHGTADCMARARKAGIEVREVYAWA